MTVAIYARISQDRTGAGLGVERQTSDCRKLAQAKGWDVGPVFADNDTSAFKRRTVRKGYRALLEAMRAGEVDAVIAWHSDRLLRQPRELEDLIEAAETIKSIPIEFVMDSPYDLTTANGRLVARISGAVASHESEHKAERLRRKHVELAENGQVPGGGRRPFGFDHDRVTVRPEEAAEIRSMARRVLAGESVRSVTVDLNGRGVHSVTGGPWSPTTVKRLLRSGRISGQREHHGRITAKAEWPAIITPAETARLRAILDDPTRGENQTRTPRSYLLSGLVRCGKCGDVLGLAEVLSKLEQDVRAKATRRVQADRDELRSILDRTAKMTARPVLRKGQYRYRRYFCAMDRGGCNAVGIGAEPLEDLVVQAVLLRLDTPDLAAEIAKAEAPTATAEVDVSDIERRLDELADMYAAGDITKPEWSRARESLRKRLTQAHARIVTASRNDALRVQVGEPGELRRRWPTMGFEAQRLVLEQLVEAVIVAPTTRANNKFDPDRVNIVWRL